MRFIKRKIFLIHQHEKEEAWLNSMAAKGLGLISFRGIFTYEFEECERGEYTYKIELLESMPNSPESRKYIKFMEEMGVEMIGSYFRWVYFRKKVSDGPFELFSDLDSKITHYRRIRNLAIPLVILEFVIGFIQLLNAYSTKVLGLYFVSGIIIFLGCCFAGIALSINKKLSLLQGERNIRE